mmetsp:Transcript_11172/g.29784  ORF Transcript_11172/g.29784 Transcript_11172/m.29784 type:complete len:277 (-) Transcript_11172:62-892(-)
MSSTAAPDAAAADIERPAPAAADIERPAPDLCADPFLTSGAGGGATGLNSSAGGSSGLGAGSAAEEGGGDGSAQEGTAAYSGGSGGCFLAMVMVWQAVALSHHSSSFPGSIFTGEHKSGMTPSCEMLFWVTNWSLFLSIFMIAMDGVLLIAGRTRGIEGCLQVVKLGEGVAHTLKIFIAVMGIWVVAFKVKSEETVGCAELYSCAWWCFVGFLLIPCLICGLFIAGVRAGHAAARDSLPTAEGALLARGPSYGTVPQPAQPAPGVEPFAGQGHRLA